MVYHIDVPDPEDSDSSVVEFLDMLENHPTAIGDLAAGRLSFSDISKLTYGWGIDAHRIFRISDRMYQGSHSPCFYCGLVDEHHEDCPSRTHAHTDTPPDTQEVVR